MAPPALSTISVELLAACYAALPSPPDRYFVSHNAPAWDLCEEDQLTVHLANVQFRQSTGPRARQSVANPLWTVQIIRCVPGVTNQGGSPLVSRLQDSALDLLDDLDAIQQAVRADAETIFGGCRAINFAQAIPLGPSGNVGGYSWPISAEVVGIAPPAS